MPKKLITTLLNQKFRTMEPTKQDKGTHVGEAPENEMTNETTQQPVDMSIRLDELETENRNLKKDLAKEKSSGLRNFRMAAMLEGALTNLIEQGKVTDDDVKKAIIEGQGLTTFKELMFSLTN